MDKKLFKIIEAELTTTIFGLRICEDIPDSKGPIQYIDIFLRDNNKADKDCNVMYGFDPTEFNFQGIKEFIEHYSNPVNTEGCLNINLYLELINILNPIIKNYKATLFPIFKLDLKEENIHKCYDILYDDVQNNINVKIKYDVLLQVYNNKLHDFTFNNMINMLRYLHSTGHNIFAIN